MAMERREDSTLTSPDVTPFGRFSMTAVCRGDKTEDEKQSGFSLFFFTPFSNTTVFYAYIILLLLFFAYPFCNSFIPPLTLVHSILFFQVSPVTLWPTASSLVLSFSAISYSGDKPQRMTWQRIGEKIAQRIPA